MSRNTDAIGDLMFDALTELAKCDDCKTYRKTINKRQRQKKRRRSMTLLQRVKSGWGRDVFVRTIPGTRHTASIAYDILQGREAELVSGLHASATGLEITRDNGVLRLTGRLTASRDGNTIETNQPIDIRILSEHPFMRQVMSGSVELGPRLTLLAPSLMPDVERQADSLRLRWRIRPTIVRTRFPKISVDINAVELKRDRARIIVNDYIQPLVIFGE